MEEEQNRVPKKPQISHYSPAPLPGLFIFWKLAMCWRTLV